MTCNRSSDMCPVVVFLAVIAVETGSTLSACWGLSGERRRKKLRTDDEIKHRRRKPTPRASNNRTIIFIMQHKNVYDTRTRHDHHDTPCATAPTEAGARPGEETFRKGRRRRDSIRKPVSLEDHHRYTRVRTLNDIYDRRLTRRYFTMYSMGEGLVRF